MLRIVIDAFVLRFPRTGIVNVVYNTLKNLKQQPECDLTILLQDLQFSQSDLRDFACSFKYTTVRETWSDRKLYHVRRLLMDRGLSINLPLPQQVQRNVKTCDIYHCTDWYYYPARRAHKNIITVYDMTSKLFPSHHEKTNIVKEDRKRRRLADFDTIIAISESTREDVIKHANVRPEKVVTLPLGADAAYENPTILDRRHLLQYYGIAPERRYILSVSTIEPRKNIVGLLNSFRLLLETSRNYNDVMLVLVGPMGWRNEGLARHLVDYPYKDRIVFPGYVALEDMPSFYYHASCFAYLSFYEGFGLPILEAMKSSCPVVCSNVSSMPEVIGDCGIMVSPTEPSEAAEAMRRILDKPSLAGDFRMRGLERSRGFNWTDYTTRLLEVYRA